MTNQTNNQTRKASLKRLQKRLLLSAAVWLGFCFTFLFFGPLELTAFSADSLVFTWRDALGPLTLVFLGVWLVATALTALLKGKAFRITLALVSVLTLSGYLQSAFLNGDLGKLTGDAIDWSAHTKALVMSLAVWACILAAMLVLMIKNRKIFRKTVVIIALLLTLMQLAPTVGILSGAYAETQTPSADCILSDEGFATFSKKENVLVIVLDRLDYDYVNAALRSDPQIFADFDGFTLFDNAVSGHARTRPALIHMLTGAEDLIFQVSSQELYSKAWTYGGRDLLADIQKSGYSIETYTKMNYLFSDMAYADRYVRNFCEDKQPVDKAVLTRKLLQLSAYRYAPTALKPLFWADTNYFNRDVLPESTINAYEFDDPAYYASLAQATADRNAPAFKLYHFFGPHAPYTMNADGTASDTDTTSTAQMLGNFRNLSKFFHRLRELGLYDSATIIITADHGSAVSDMKALQKATRIGLFYKPAGATGQLQMSSAPVRTTDIPATVLKAMGADYSAYGPALDEIPEDSSRVRTYYKTIYTGDPIRENYIYTYEIHGPASDFSSWHLITEGPIPYGYN